MSTQFRPWKPLQPSGANHAQIAERINAMKGLYGLVRIERIVQAAAQNPQVSEVRFDNTGAEPFPAWVRQSAGVYDLDLSAWKRNQVLPILATGVASAENGDLNGLVTVESRFKGDGPTSYASIRVRTYSLAGSPADGVLNGAGAEIVLVFYSGLQGLDDAAD